MNAALRALFAKGDDELLADLAEAVAPLHEAVIGIAELAAEDDRRALDRLERLAERLDGLRRLAMQARAALSNRLPPSGSAA